MVLEVEADREVRGHAEAVPSEVGGGAHAGGEEELGRALGREGGSREGVNEPNQM